VALFALAVLPFLASLGAEFTVDDHPTVEDAPLLGEIGWRVFADARFVRTLSIMADRWLFGMDPVGFHVTNLLLHAGSTLLAYGVLLRFARNGVVAFVAAAAFAVHPSHVEVVTNIANRKESLCFLFSLASFAAYLRTLDAADRAGQLRCLALTAALGVLAIGAKQVAIVLPLAAVAGAALGAAYIEWEMGWSTLLEYRTVKGFIGEPTVGEIALSSASFFWRYIELLLIPARLCPDHVADAAAIAGSLWLALCWAALIGFVALAVWLGRSAPVTAFGLWWIAIHLLPTLNLLPSAYALADRYLYIPSFGLCLLIVGIARELPPAAQLLERHPRKLALAAAAVGVVLALQAGSYNRVWLAEEPLWRHTLQCEPDSFRAHMNVGSYDYLAGRHGSAQDHFERAVALNPEDARAHFNLGNAQRRQARYQRAASSYAKAAELGLEPAREQLERLRSQRGVSP
jgi:tetratricopeptide (TPR) repeat protein